MPRARSTTSPVALAANMRLVPVKSPAEPGVGDLAPQFEAADDQGKIHSLRDYKGKTIVLYFYPNDKKICMAYGVWKEKSMYGRKYMGVERSTFVIGPDGRIKAVWRKVSVHGHVDEVLKSI